MSFLVFATLFALSCLSLADAGSTWSYCSGTGPGHLTVDNVTLNPDPPQRGHDEVVSLVGTVDEVVNGGTIHLQISYSGFVVYDHTYNVCDTITCPSSGPNVSASITIPGSAIPSISPAGAYLGKATLVDQTGASLACVQVQFTLPPSQFPVKMSPKAAAELVAQFNGVEF